MAWNNEFRIDGTPADTRYSSIEEAEKARRRVRRMVPNRTKGKKETGGRRPNKITCERMHHSKGKKWDEFLEAMGFTQLSEAEQLLLMDSSFLGGNEVFAKWKQREHEKWTPIKRVVVYSYSTREVIKVQLADGTIVEEEYKSPASERKKRLKTQRAIKRSSKPKYCATCQTKLPTSIASHETKCKACQPVAAADSFFANIMKNKQEA
jgi:hypothetical protein